MAEKGRVCWAMAREVPTHLASRIARETTVSEGALQEIFRECRARGTPFGEILISRGMITPEILRSLLLDQVGLAMGSLVSGTLVSGAPVSGAPVSGTPVSGTPVSGTPVSGTPVSGTPVSGTLASGALSAAALGRWVAAPTRTYNPAYTFSSVEVVGSVRMHHPELFVCLPPRPPPFDHLVEKSLAAVCLTEVDREQRLALPVLVHGGIALGQGELGTLLCQARSFLRSPALVATSLRPYLAFARQEHFYLIFAGCGVYLMVAEVEDPASLVLFASDLRRWQREAAAAGEG